jgi:hypothetical protein
MRLALFARIVAVAVFPLAGYATHRARHCCWWQRGVVVVVGDELKREVDVGARPLKYMGLEWLASMGGWPSNAYAGAAELTQ